MGKLKKFMCENAMGNQIRVYGVRGLMSMFCFLLVNEYSCYGQWLSRQTRARQKFQAEGGGESRRSDKEALQLQWETHASIGAC